MQMGQLAALTGEGGSASSAPWKTGEGHPPPRYGHRGFIHYEADISSRQLLGPKVKHWVFVSSRDARFNILITPQVN